MVSEGNSHTKKTALEQKAEEAERTSHGQSAA